MFGTSIRSRWNHMRYTAGSGSGSGSNGNGDSSRTSHGIVMECMQNILFAWSFFRRFSLSHLQVIFVYSLSYTYNTLSHTCATPSFVISFVLFCSVLDTIRVVYILQMLVHAWDVFSFFHFLCIASACITVLYGTKKRIVSSVQKCSHSMYE